MTGRLVTRLNIGLGIVFVLLLLSISATVSAANSPDSDFGTGAMSQVVDTNTASIDLFAMAVGGVCGDAILDAGEQCDDGNAAGGDGCSATCQVEDGWNCTDPIPPGPVNIIADPGFEAGAFAGIWDEYSLNYGTPVCDDACGFGAGSGPHSGDWWTWFGGFDGYEEGAMSQSVVIPTAATDISFYAELSSCDTAEDYLELTIDGNQEWVIDGSDPTCGANYTQYTVDVSAYADGAAHTVAFHSEIFLENEANTGFFLDDVELVNPNGPPIPSECTLNAAEIAVDPPVVRSVQPTDSSNYQALDIHNVGELELTWTIYEAAGVPTVNAANSRANASSGSACDTPADIGWVSVSPTTGATASAALSTVQVQFDATGLAPGEYAGTLCIESNDPQTPLVEVPLQHIVDEPPTVGTCEAGTVPQDLFYDDFENGAAGWSTSSAIGPNTWAVETGIQGPVSGTYVYHVDNLGEISDQYLVSPAVALPTGESPLTLQFYNYQEIENSDSYPLCYDGGVLEISTDGGATWQRLESELLNDPYDFQIPADFGNPIGGTNAWCGDPQDWLNSIVNVDGFAGQTVQFRWRMGTDDIEDHPGWDIDNVRVQSCVEESPTAVEMADLDATVNADGSVTVAWATSAEVNNAGFNVYRSVSAENTGEQLNSDLIASTAAAGAGANYSYVDTAVGNGTFYYSVEAVATDGATTVHGPVIAITQAPTSASLTGLNGSSATLLPWLFVGLMAVVAVSLVGFANYRKQ